MRDIPPAHPGVWFPPPFLYVIGFGIGLWLQRSRPLGLISTPHTGSHRPVWILGLLCLVAWAALMLGAMVTFRRSRTTMLPNRPAAALATGGPYRITRNPMYLGLAFLYIGLALLLNTVWPLAFLPLVLIAIDVAVIRREERYLTATFGEAYRAYCARVRRWV